ncbi:MAG: molybdopterin-dependent oxidoreductase [Clostridium sp.]
MKKYSSGCTLDCFDCCKFDVYKDENGEIEIKGDKNHPFTKGFICKKGLYHKDIIKNEKRIIKPLLKVNGKFEEVSFDKGINIIIEKLNKCKNEEIIYYEQYGNGGLLKSIGDIFFNFYGGVLKQKGGPCWSAGIKAQKLDFKKVLRHSLDDLENSKTIIVWGKNPAFTSIHEMKAILDAKRNGSYVITIDPIKTKTAELSNYYISPKPNGDYYLALAMGKYIIGENLIDKDFIRERVENFSEYKKDIESFNMEELVEKSGVSLEEIEKLSKLYTNKPSTIILGYGLQKYKNGGNTIRAIDALGMITGQIGIEGGGVNYANKLYGDILNLDPYESHKYAKNVEFSSGNIGEVIEKEKVKMLFITKSNILNQLPNINKLKESFKKVDFKVCFDIYMTDTAKECDLFIPSTITLESEDLLFSSMTNPYLICKEEVIEPMNPLMDEYNFYNELAKRLKIENYPIDIKKKEYLNKVLEPLNVTVNTVKNEYITKEIKVPFKENEEKFSIGSFEIKREEKRDGLRLLTNHSKDTLFSQHFMDKEGISEFFINEKEGLKLNLKNKEIYKLKSKVGEVKAKCIIDNKIKDGVVMMEVGWHERHGNPNYLTKEDISDIGLQIAYNETIIEIEK